MGGSMHRQNSESFSIPGLCSTARTDRTSGHRDLWQNLHRERPSLLIQSDSTARWAGPMRTRAPHPSPVRRRRRSGTTDGRQRGATRPQQRPRRWWLRPRMRSALLLGVLAVVTLLARVAAHLETDWLWFHELGQERV